MLGINDLPRTEHGRGGEAFNGGGSGGGDGFNGGGGRRGSGICLGTLSAGGGEAAAGDPTS